MSMEPMAGVPAIAPFNMLESTALGFAGDIAELWTVGPLDACHIVATGDSDSLLQPAFESSLQYQHVSPFMADKEPVREPFTIEFTAIVERRIRRGDLVIASPSFQSEFDLAYGKRQPRKTKAQRLEDKAAGVQEDNEAPGLYQRFMDRRRAVRTDNITKVMQKFLGLGSDGDDQETKKQTMEEAAENPAIWRITGQGDCYYFTRPGAVELFHKMFNPPVVGDNRRVLSLTQVALADTAAKLFAVEKKAKSRGVDGIVKAMAEKLVEDLPLKDEHPCQCCWTVDIGGLGSPGNDSAAEDSDGGSGSEAAGSEADKGVGIRNVDKEDGAAEESD